jgi:hypothetical protein
MIDYGAVAKIRRENGLPSAVGKIRGKPNLMQYLSSAVTRIQKRTQIILSVARIQGEE